MIFNGNIIEEFFLQRQITYRKNYPLSKASTFRIGGNAAFACISSYGVRAFSTVEFL